MYNFVEEQEDPPWAVEGAGEVTVAMVMMAAGRGVPVSPSY